MLCNVYLPSNPGKSKENLDDFKKIINSVCFILQDSNTDYVIFGGDINTDFSCFNAKTVEILKSMIEREMIHKIEACSIDFTTKIKIKESKFVLEYIFVSSNLMDYVKITLYYILVITCQTTTLLC